MAHDVMHASDAPVKVLAPRLDTPSDTPASRRSASRLPDELTAEQLQRLALFGAIVGGLWTLGLFMDVVMTPLTWGTPVSMRKVSVDLCGMAVSVWMYWYAKYCTHHPPQTKTEVSL